MRKENKKYLGVSLSALAFSLSYGLTANAQTCVTPPSCEELGYTDAANECDNTAMIKCPFDTSKVFCRNKTTKNCDTIGDILLDNKTCAIDINSLDPKRIPIGVVFDTSRKLAIAIHDSDEQLQWASKNIDIPSLVNYSRNALINDFNGKTNTSYIIAHGDSNGYDTPAADFCYNYTTNGTEKGDWYLPAAGEFQLIYNNKDKLNSSLLKIDGTIFKNEIPDTYSTSTEAHSHSPWGMSLKEVYWGSYSKQSKLKVRPVIAF